MLSSRPPRVEAEGRITPGCLGLWDDATEAALQPVLAAVRQHATMAVAIQLAHAGRKASSHVPWEGGQQIPLAERRLADGRRRPPCRTRTSEAPPTRSMPPAWRACATPSSTRRAGAPSGSGIDAIELHAAHGYLLHQFLSPICQPAHRRAMAARCENRMRFPLEVFDAVRAAFPADRPVGVRVSATDWVEGGWDLAQTVAFAQELKQRGVDWIDVSRGGVSPLQKIPLGPGYQVPFAQAIKEATGVPTIAVGLITEPQQAEEIMAAGKADLVALARGMLYDPRWPWHAAAELGAQVEAPPQYWRSQPSTQKALFGGTTFGARVGQAGFFLPLPQGEKGRGVEPCRARISRVVLSHLGHTPGVLCFRLRATDAF